MQKREDGWDDVRSAIETAKKDRAGAAEQLKNNFERDTSKITSSAAVRWTKVGACTLASCPPPPHARPD